MRSRASLSGSTLSVCFLLMSSAFAFSQQKQGGTHGGPPPQQHAAPQSAPHAAPQMQQRAPSGGMGGAANRGGPNAGGAGGVNRGPNAAGANASRGSSNPYGAYATRNPSAGSNAGGAKSSSSNPYGAYANRSPNTGANAGRGATTAGGAGKTAGMAAGRGSMNAGAKGSAAGPGARGTAAAHGSTATGAGNARGGMAGKGATVGGSTRGGASARGGSVGGATNAKGGAAGRGSASRNVATRQITTKSGAKVTASYRGNSVRSVQAKGMRIDHHVHGDRRIVSERNGRRVVSMGHGRGYAEHAYMRHGGRAYYQRTYYYGGRRYAYAYRGYYYHGYRYYGYAPGYYYRPAYYGWAYNPWPAPVYYNWGWAGNPWYGAYNYYYAPYPAYPAASYWLTDYMFAEHLRAAYEVGALGKPFENSPVVAALWSADPLVAAELGTGYAGALYAGGSQPTLSKEVKDAIGEEIKQQIAADKNASGQTQAGGSEDDPLPALDSNFRYFIVASNLDLDAEGQECGLSQGDVIQRTGDTPDGDNKVEVIVRASKRDDCAVGTNGLLEVNELQEMYNHFREQLDAGLKSLAENSGKSGLPKAPDTSTVAGEVPPPQADAGVDSDLQQQEREADQTEAELKQGSGGN